jgi:ATP-dependent DNA helicase RecG
MKEGLIAPPNVSSPDPLAQTVTGLHGVGPERSTQLARVGIHTVRDLLLYRPRRYEDRRRTQPIAALELGRTAAVQGRVVALGIKRFAQGRKSVFELIVDDGTARLHCRWWNLPYLQNYFHQGEEVIVFGKPIQLKPRTMDHPETELVDSPSESSIHLNRIAPVYPLTEGLPQRWLRSLIWRTLDQFGALVSEPWASDLLPGFMSRARAIQRLHFPEEMSDAEQARRRLALDELTELQLAIQGRRRALHAHAQSRPCAGDNRLVRPFLARLGFSLTKGQTQVLRELRRDLGGPYPMRRLLQGDVGSGKTVVAACTALIVMESGYSVAIMAPTEILAQQHFTNFRRWFEPLGIEVHLQTGSQKTLIDSKQGHGTVRPNDLVQQANTAAIKPPPRLVAGTHALVEESFTLDHLGLVIIDEQHRFGVAQREKLVRKGRYPHLLVMTATPIPRTLGLTLYGDLDISVIPELPDGRVPIHTYVRTTDRLPKVWAFVREKLSAGRQAYVVYPRVEDTGQGLKAVTKEFEILQTELTPFKVGLLHGRLSAEEKDKTMRAFRANELQVLLSTSLIEVGIDVPNASLLLVENAEQFGLAQLHQLRGRIGRGAHESYCILITHAKTDEARRRLRILEQTPDGFRIAEADLQLRGPGDLLGQQQSGLPPLQFADLATDLGLVEQARGAAAELLGE